MIDHRVMMPPPLPIEEFFKSIDELQCTSIRSLMLHPLSLEDMREPVKIVNFYFSPKKQHPLVWVSLENSLQGISTEYKRTLKVLKNDRDAIWHFLQEGACDPFTLIEARCIWAYLIANGWHSPLAEHTTTK